MGVQKLTRRSEFDKLLLSAVDEALKSLGESVKQSIYFHIEEKFKLARNEIPQNLEELQMGLERIFGEGSRFVEIQIMKNLHRKIGLFLKMETKTLEFIEYISVARKSFLLEAG